MSYEDAARKDLGDAWDGSADAMRQIAGGESTTEETLDTVKDLLTATANNTIRLAAVIDILWNANRQLVTHVQALAQEVERLR